jgi:predicted lipoprotein with Yx(FWY)xxD motif
MMLRFIAAAAGVLMAASAFAASSDSSRSRAAEEFAPLSTPKGITIQSIGRYHGYGLDQTTAALSGRGEMVFADAAGKTLYTYAKDPAGKSVCVAGCVREWIPAPVLAGAQAVGDWTIITRPDGSKQWALRGKPVYTYVNDIDPGSVGGNSPKRYGRGAHISERGRTMIPIVPDVPLPPDWKAAMFFPAGLENVPSDFLAKNLLDAPGMALQDQRGWTLYVYTGAAEKEREHCPGICEFRPMPAPQLAAANGDFVPVERTDGIRQWTYKGLGLYTYAGDLATGDAEGVEANPNWKVAHITRNFMPPNVTVQYSHRIGKVLADGNGKTLYRRDSYIFQSGSGHGQRRGVLVRAAVGRDLGINTRCVKECDKWHPFLAPEDAVAQGDWSFYVRPDGKKQWAYVGYALWTYDGDTKPGDVRADDDWQNYISLTERTDSVVDIGTQYDTVATLYWAAMPP